LLSRGHYTIDIIASLFIGFTLYTLSSKYLRKYFVIQDYKTDITDVDVWLIRFKYSYLPFNSWNVNVEKI